MRRSVVLVGAFLLIIGALITLDLPMNWVGKLSGDFSVKLRGVRVSIPLATSVVFSFALRALLSVLPK